MSTEAAQLSKRVEAYRDYPVELKAAVIAAIEQNGGNVLATSRLFNLPRDTVNYWWRHSDRFVELKHASSLNLADKLEGIAHNYADSIADHDLQVVSVRDKAAVMNTAIQNMQLLRGQPTSITETMDRGELLNILQSALNAGVIDVTPERSDESE